MIIIYVDEWIVDSDYKVWSVSLIEVIGYNKKPRGLIFI